MATTLFATILIAIPARGSEIITLDQAIGRALEIGPTLANAAANSDLNRARLVKARSPLYPNLAETGGYTQSPNYDKARSQIVFDTTAAYFDLVRTREQESKVGADR
jgi:outer membrane protein TolC